MEITCLTLELVPFRNNNLIFKGEQVYKLFLNYLEQLDVFP